MLLTVLNCMNCVNLEKAPSGKDEIIMFTLCCTFRFLGEMPLLGQH